MLPLLKCCSALLVRFEVCRRGGGEKNTPTTYYMWWEAGRDAQGRDSGGETVAEQERERWREVILG